MKRELLKSRYPEEKDDVIELAFIFQDMEKAKRYISEIDTCGTYDALAGIILKMYRKGDIDEVRAKSEDKFIAKLLPFATGLDVKRSNAHSAAHHIRRLIDAAVKDNEREKYQLDKIEKELRQKGIVDDDGHVVTSMCIPESTSLDVLKRIYLYAGSLDVQLQPCDWSVDNCTGTVNHATEGNWQLHTHSDYGFTPVMERNGSVINVREMKFMFTWEAWPSIEKLYYIQGDIKKVVQFIYKASKFLNEYKAVAFLQKDDRDGFVELPDL